jgi:hypothetical protein
MSSAEKAHRERVEATVYFQAAAWAAVDVRRQHGAESVLYRAAKLRVDRAREALERSWERWRRASVGDVPGFAYTAGSDSRDPHDSIRSPAAGRPT